MGRKSRDEELKEILSAEDEDTRSKAATCPVCFAESCKGCTKVSHPPGKGVKPTGKAKKTVHPERKARARRRGVL